MFFLPSENLMYSPVVSKKISKRAVVRNKIKRRIKHLSRMCLKSGKFVIVSKKDISNICFETVKNDFKKISSKIN